ncbi:hypothetical protein AGIG_G24922 [Arapaima gigas]
MVNNWVKRTEPDRPPCVYLSICLSVSRRLRPRAAAAASNTFILARFAASRASEQYAVRLLCAKRPEGGDGGSSAPGPTLALRFTQQPREKLEVSSEKDAARPPRKEGIRRPAGGRGKTRAAELFGRRLCWTRRAPSATRDSSV